MSQATPKKPAVVDEDVEDLDDVLEQFNAPHSKAPPSTKSTATPSKSASTPSKPTPAPAPNVTSTSATSTSQPAAQPKLGLDDLNLSDDFAAELAKGMASLMREIASEASPGDGGEEGSEEDKERELAFRKAWEAMLVDEMDGVTPSMDGEEFGGPKSKGKEKEADTAKGEKKADTTTKGAGDDDFQRSIRKAMEKLKESETNLQAESAAGSDDPFEALLSSLGEGATGGESEEELQGMLESMMTQLMSKEVLYEPLKELHDKFPGYMRDNASKIKPEEKTRYEAQQVIITKIITIFDDPSYSDDNPEQGVKVVGLMNEMQSYGSPPAEIMGPLPPGLDMGPDGLPKLPDGCTIA